MKPVIPDYGWIIFGVRVTLYMLFYATGSGLGAMATTAAYAVFGWQGVCLLGAAVSLLALMVWTATQRWVPVSNNL